MKMNGMAILAIALLGIGSAPSPASSCPAFREPAVNFAGLTSRDQISEYFSRVVEPQIWAAQDELISCHRRLVDEAPRGYKGETRTRNDIESEQWGADMSRFVQRFTQASNAHLALLAAQPFQGAYSAHSSARTSDQTAGDGAGGGQGRNQGSARPTYAPYTHCAEVVHKTQSNDELYNQCDRALEFYWRDGGANWNSMTTIAPGKHYPYAGKVLQVVACSKGDLFDKSRKVCVDW